MKIRIKGYLTLKRAMDNMPALEMEMESATIRDVLEALSNRFGKDFRNLVFDSKTEKVSGQIRVFVNGRHYTFLLKRMNTELKDGDEVSLFPALAGG